MMFDYVPRDGATREEVVRDYLERNFEAGHPVIVMSCVDTGPRQGFGQWWRIEFMEAKVKA